jgi:hypothetical protein
MYAADWPKLPHFPVAPDKDNQNARGFQDWSQSEAYMVCAPSMSAVSKIPKIPESESLSQASWMSIA